MHERETEIVVLGAGFGGLEFCQTFTAPGVHITVVDRTNHHLFQPLLYQVATAGLSAPDVAQPIRSILSSRENITVLMDNVIDVKLAEKKVILNDQTLSYDYLILAMGGVTSYFGHPEWEPFAPGLKTLADATRIRSQILLAFEHAETEPTPENQQKFLTIVVVGGGPTGVELAGAFAELSRNVLKEDFRRIDPTSAHVLLIEASPRVLASYPPNLSASGQKQLEKLGVQVRTNTRVKNITENEIELESGEKIHAANIIWGAGVGASPITKKLGVELDKAGRIKVAPDLSIPGHPEVFAIGDLAAALQENGKPVPGVSPAAMQMGKYAGRVIETELAFLGKTERTPFKYWDKGTMATIGRSAAVAQIGKFEFTGFTAWLAWLGVHLVFLVGFRNKIAVLFSWFYSYITYKRGARIIHSAMKPDGGTPVGEGKTK